MTLAPRNSRLVAVALLVATIALGYVLIAEPLMKLYAAQQDEITMLASRASRVAKRPEDVAALKAQLGTLQTQAGNATPFWPGETDAVALAGLQERVTTLLQTEGADIGSAEAMPPVVENGVHKIALKVRFDSEIDQLGRIVHGIETMSPSLMVDHLTVRDLGAQPASATPLSVELQVYGFAAGQPKQRPSS